MKADSRAPPESEPEPDSAPDSAPEPELVEASVAEHAAGAERIELYLDDAAEPLLRQRPPAAFQLDTRALDDGPHVLRVEAWDGSGKRGVRQIPFGVRNGPAISVDGLGAGAVVEGQLSLVVHAYAGGNEDHWKPELAEVPAPVPTWAWIILICVIAWAMFYVVRYGQPEGTTGLVSEVGPSLALCGSHQRQPALRFRTATFVVQG
jgi:hypothetical protein